MIQALSVILVFQLGGEVAARALALPVPGPVIGMAALVGAFALVPALFEAVREVAQGVVAHLSLLFVPAGVGIVGHIDRLGAHGGAILLALVVSTGLAIAVGALVFTGVAWLTGRGDGGTGDRAPDA